MDLHIPYSIPFPSSIWMLICKEVYDVITDHSVCALIGPEPHNEPHGMHIVITVKVIP